MDQNGPKMVQKWTKNCEIWLKLWYLADIVIFGWYCNIWLILWNLTEIVIFGWYCDIRLIVGYLADIVIIVWYCVIQQSNQLYYVRMWPPGLKSLKAFTPVPIRRSRPSQNTKKSAQSEYDSFDLRPDRCEFGLEIQPETSLLGPPPRGSVCVFKETRRSRGPVSHQGKRRTQPRSDDLSSWQDKSSSRKAESQ